MPIENRTKEEIKMKKLKNLKYMLEPNNNVVQGSTSPWSISIDQLNTLLCLHLRPIKLVVCK